MTSRDFCYWLQGLFEVGKPTTLDAAQIDLIQRHLNMVFHHEIDPSFGKDNPALNKIHGLPPNLTKQPDSLTGDPQILYRC